MSRHAPGGRPSAADLPRHERPPAAGGFGPQGRIDAWLTLPERRPAAVIFAIGLLFTAAYLSSLVLLPKADGRILLGDALHHYVQLRSLVFDGDLHFQNDYIRLYGLEGPDPETRWIYVDFTPTGHVRNVMPVGPALLWAPAFLAAALLVLLGNAAGWAYPLDGYGRLFQATPGLTGTLAAACGVWLTYRACTHLFSARAAIWASLTMWLASSAVYYSVISPAYSHAASLLANAAFWYAFVKLRDEATYLKYAVLGALAGAAALMRWQDAVLLLAIGVELLWRVRGTGAVAGRAATAALAAACVFAPQMAVWQVLYGQPLAIPQGAGFMRWSDPALASVLFSTWRGLLTWTPIVAAGVAGLPWLLRRDRVTATAAMLVLCVAWYVNAAVADWWAGEAFGARRFVGVLPLFTMGLAALLDRWRPAVRTVAVVSAAAIVHTFLLLVQYQAFMKGLRDVVPYPRGASELWLARFRVPFDLLAWWWNR